ncbi:uncharacterized protein LOC120634963 isoform X4 [Pararge aegeria]|nr:uncharacterized protein LOC120634963 isoform X4 [Pararge aegeria]
MRIISSDDRLHKRSGIIITRPILNRTKYPKDINKLLYASSEMMDSSDENGKTLRKNAQSSDSVQYNSAELEKVIFLPNNSHKYIKTAEVLDSTNEDVGIAKEGLNSEQSLRGKEEFKCVDACKEVLSNVCAARNCKDRERHIFDKECFSACKSRF